MWEIIGALLFVASSGLLFNKKHQKNAVLVTIAGVVAIVATILMTQDLVSRLVDRKLAERSVNRNAPGDFPSSRGQINIKKTNPNAPEDPNTDAEHISGKLQVSREDIEGARAYNQHEFSKAWAILSPLAGRGDPIAQYFVGIMTLRGNVVVRDPKMAYELLQHSAQRGIADAQNSMALFYRRGLYVQQNYGEAMRWYDLAARQGYKNAQYWIALLYRDGHGVERDTQTAYMWALMASSEGDATATILKENLEKSLSPAEIEQARENAAQWQLTNVTPNPISIHSLIGASPQ